MNKDNRRLAQLCAEAARICLAGEIQDSLACVCDAIQDRLLLEGRLPGEREEIERLFIRELLCRLLAEANAIYGYPHTDADLCKLLLPAWLACLSGLERPRALREAFCLVYEQRASFPAPLHVLAYLPGNALKRSRQDLAEETRPESHTPGLPGELHRKFREKCKVIKFSSLARKNQIRLPLDEQAAGE